MAFKNRKSGLSARRAKALANAAGDFERRFKAHANAADDFERRFKRHVNAAGDFERQFKGHVNVTGNFARRFKGHVNAVDDFERRFKGHVNAAGDFERRFKAHVNAAGNSARRAKWHVLLKLDGKWGFRPRKTQKEGILTAKNAKYAKLAKGVPSIGLLRGITLNPAVEFNAKAQSREDAKNLGLYLVEKRLLLEKPHIASPFAPLQLCASALTAVFRITHYNGCTVFHPDAGLRVVISAHLP